jgi:hypothetical protein
MNNTFFSEDSAQTQGGHAALRNRRDGRLLRRTFVIALILVSGGLLTGSAGAEERTYPVKIGVLTASWGPTPQTVGLRDGLLELGYKEDKQFVLGVRFTQRELTTLPAAARELVQSGVDIIRSNSPLI